MSLATAKLEKRLARIRQIPLVLIPTVERSTYKITQVKKGGVLVIEGTPFLVEDVSWYREMDQGKPVDWPELKLFNLETGETIYIEIEEDDEIEVSLTTKKIHFRDLKDDEGGSIDDDDLDQIVEDEDDIYYNGRVFSYEDDYGAKYLKGGKRKAGYPVYFYDFLAVDGTCLTVEEWGSEEHGYEYELYLSRSIDLFAIEILHLGE